MEKEVEIKLPKLGESIVTATIVQWFKKVGDIVKLDEPLVEVSTDKVNSEIPSPVSGVLKKILAKPDQEIEVGAPLAIIALKEITPSEESKLSLQEKEPFVESAPPSLYTPVVLKMAKEQKISLEELKQIPATGAGGRLSKRDLECYIEEKQKRKSSPSKKTQKIERITMSSIRKKIADNMVRSFYEAPHASLITEVDISSVKKLIDEKKKDFFDRHGYKLTITSFIAKAMTKAIKEYPFINSSLEENTIVIKHFVNLGIAVSIDQGLLVPVIQNCQDLSLVEIAKEIDLLAKKARSGSLKPDEITQGTITLTNFGMTGTLIGIPIIRHQEVAIIGVGAIQKRVLPLENNTIGVRSTVHLSLTFDHRVIDGIYGCGFLNTIKKYLEEESASNLWDTL